MTETRCFFFRLPRGNGHPQDHLAWFILGAVELLDFPAFPHRYRQDGWGRAAYPPGMMVAVFAHAYCTGVSSSRIRQNF